MATLLKSDIVLAAEQNVSRGSEIDTLTYTKLDYILQQIYLDYTWDFSTSRTKSSYYFYTWFKYIYFTLLIT